MGQNQAAEPGDLDSVIGRPVRMFGQPNRISGAWEAGLKVAFQRSDLGRLIVQRIEAVRVAGENLERRDDRRHRHRHREHQPRAPGSHGRG